MKCGLSIIIPAFNEENGIELVLNELVKTMKASDLLYEIIVVNDGSNDSTGDIIAQQSDVRLIQHEKNRGYGASLKTGIRHARYETICITDADGTYPNERIPELYNHMINGSYDMVVGARNSSDSSLIRRPAKRFIRALAERMTEEYIPDFNSGLRVFKKEIARKFFGLFPDGFSFTTTITLSMLNNGYHVAFVPIEYHPRIGNSKIHPIKDTKNFILLVLRLSLYFQPLKIFMPISSALFILSIVWGLFSSIVLGKLADVSTIVLFIGSVQVGAVGLLAELIDCRVPNHYQEEVRFLSAAESGNDHSIEV